MYQIYHDFNKLFPGKSEDMRSAPLVCYGTKCDLDALGIALEDGMEVLLYQPDDVTATGEPDQLQVRAKIRWDSNEQCFMADFIWAELMYRSKFEARNNIQLAD